jgi:thiol:disulfide interchange protein DsbC
VIKGQLVYVSPDGKYVVAGSVWDTQDKKNITEVRNAEIRRTALAAVPLTKRIVFPAKKEKYIVTVFTDIDCGYCRQLHQQVAEYNNRGISLHYLFFPRAGKGSEGWKHAEAVWCSADPQAALTKAKKGEAVESKACSNPVEADYELGLQVGVSGTPAIFTADGTQIGGYIPPDQMLARLSEMDSAKK